MATAYNIPSALEPGDSVEILAPASRCSRDVLKQLKNLLISWNLNVIINNDLFGDDLLCANSDESRFHALKNALQNPSTQAIICVRGGYGSMRLIPELSQISPPLKPKWFVGMSDITALHLFLGQQWGWKTLHGSLNTTIHSDESIQLLRSMLFGEIDTVELTGTPLNKSAEQHLTIEAAITGGNLCLVQTSIGTPWQLDGKDKLLFLEEIAERGYRVDRMLEHLHQAGIFKGVKAIIFGDFIGGEEPDGSSLIQPVLKRFATQCDIPVIHLPGVGHGFTNFPLPLGSKAKLILTPRETKLTLDDWCSLV